MRTVAFISQKGGAGKTTLALALAVAAERSGVPTVLVDLDPQASASRWSDLREAETPVVSCAPAARLYSILRAARREKAGLAVLAPAPQVANAALAAARASDFVLIPCRPASADLVAIAASIDLARIAHKPAAVVLNGAPVANPLTDQALEAIGGYDVTACPVVIHQRIAHVHAFTEGLSAMEREPRSKAASEIRTLYDWTKGVAGIGET